MATDNRMLRSALGLRSPLLTLASRGRLQFAEQRARSLVTGGLSALRLEAPLEGDGSYSSGVLNPGDLNTTSLNLTSWPQVLLDGVDIRTLQVKWLRRHIGVVSQEPVRALRLL